MLLRLVFIANIVKNILAKRSAIPSLALLVPYGNPLCGCFRGLQKYGHMLFADKRISGHSDQPRFKVTLLLFFCNRKIGKKIFALHLASSLFAKSHAMLPTFCDGSLRSHSIWQRLLCFFASDKSLASLHRLACKRTRNGSDSLSTFHEIAREQGLQRNFLNKSGATR